MDKITKSNHLRIVAMIEKLKLRQLINRLEELSKNGRNDDLEVVAFFCTDDVDSATVRRAYIDTFKTDNDEYDFIRLECYECD